MSGPTVEGRQRFDAQSEIDDAARREAAAQRLGEDPPVVVLRPSDEQIERAGSQGDG